MTQTDKKGENHYLRYLTYEGAKSVMELSDEIKERIDFELRRNCQYGLSGVFLIVQDFMQRPETWMFR